MRPMKALVHLLIVLAGAAQAQAQEHPIGQVGGRPIHASQIKGSTESARTQSLRALFIGPVLRAYLEPHRREWELTEQDIQQLVQAYRETLKCKTPSEEALPPDQERMFATFLGANAKVQRFIHERHGGGRILFQQAGMEAFDATGRLLLDLERQGAFSITDPALRQQTLAYWFHDEHTGLLPDPGIGQAFRLDRLIEKCPAR